MQQQFQAQSQPIQFSQFQVPPMQQQFQVQRSNNFQNQRVIGGNTQIPTQAIQRQNFVNQNQLLTSSVGQGGQAAAVGNSEVLPPPASPVNVEQPMESRYFKMICFNCGDPGHFVGNCIKPKKCFICNSPDHPAHQCPVWLSEHPCAKYFGSANHGLGFYHIDAPSEEETSWINFENCAVVHIRKGDITAANLEKNFNSIFCKHKKWPWQIRQLTDKEFLVRFPPWKSIAELVEFPAFDLETEGVTVKIGLWDGDCPSLAELPVVWMLVRGIPPKKAAWKTFAQAVTSVGVLMDVDWNTFFKSFYAEVRLQVACRDPVRIPKERIVEIDQKFYLLRFSVEGVEQNDEEEDFDDPTDDGLGEEGFDELEDPNEMSHSNLDDDGLGAGGSTTVGDITINHRSYANIPESWEDIKLDDIHLRVMDSEIKSCGEPEIEDDWECSLKSPNSLPDRLNYANVDDDVWDFEPIDYGCIDAEAILQVEQSVGSRYCSQVMEYFNATHSEDEDSVDEDAVDKDVLPQEMIDKFGSIRKNLFPVLEELAKGAGKSMVKESTRIQSKAKWGPVLKTTRMNTRFHGELNVIEKAKEYQKRKNLEIPPSFKGNSFAILPTDNLLALANGVDISIGRDAASGNVIVHDLVEKELVNSLEYARNNPTMVLPGSIDIDTDHGQLLDHRYNPSINILPSSCNDVRNQLPGGSNHIRSGARTHLVNNIYTSAIS
ncbi:hypothetical protein ACQ4PT_064127 [Festuca glaucescens]